MTASTPSCTHHGGADDAGSVSYGFIWPRKVAAEYAAMLNVVSVKRSARRVEMLAESWDASQELSCVNALRLTVTAAVKI